MREGIFEGDETVSDGRVHWDRELLPVFLALLLFYKIFEYPSVTLVKIGDQSG